MGQYGKREAVHYRSYAYTEREDTLFVHLYMAGTVQKIVQGETAEISVMTDYPWDGNIRVTVRGASHSLTIALRIPAWCDGNFQLRGADNADTWVENGYLYVRRVWTDEDYIEITLPMEVRLVQADSRVRADSGKVAVMRGPLLTICGRTVVRMKCRYGWKSIKGNPCHILRLWRYLPTYLWRIIKSQSLILEFPFYFSDTVNAGGQNIAAGR